MASKLTKIVANFETQLAVKLAVGAVTGTLSNVVDKNGTTLADGKYCMVFNLGESNEEHLKFDLVASTKAMSNIVSVKRDGTEVTGALSEHRVGAVGKITNFLNIQKITNILNGTDTLDGSSPIKYDAEPSITDRKQIPHSGYVQDVLSGAVGTASDSAAGTNKMSKNQGSKPKAQSVYVREQPSPDKTLLIESFRIALLDKTVAYAGGNTPNFIDPGFGGDLAISTNLSNTETFVLTVDGQAITFTAVSSIGATPGNFLIGGSVAATRANLAALINNPTVTNANQVALTGAALTACQKVNCTDDLALNIFIRATNPAVTSLSAVENFAGGGNTWTANTTKNRYDLVVIDSAGTLQIRKGTEAVSPTVPTPTSGDVVLCLVLNRCGMTTVRDYNVAGQSYITEWYPLGIYVTEIVPDVIGNFGQGSDGVIVFDGTNTFAFASKSGNTYTLTRDVDALTVTVNNGVTINTANYILGAKTSITNAGTIQNNGNSGGNGANNTGTTAAGGTAGTAIPAGTFAASIAGVVGGQGNGDAAAGGAGTTGLNATSVGSNGVAGGISGTSSGSQGAAGTGGTNTAETMSVTVGQGITPATLTAGSVTTVQKINRILPKTSTNNYILSTSAGSGSGGGGPSKGGGGGGSGSTGGIICLLSPVIINSGTIQALGGNGGNGGNGTDANGGSGRLSGGGGGGGGGGNGGTVVLIYKTLTNTGTISVAGGTGGTGGQPGGNGAGYGVGTAGANGSNGATGKIFYAQVNG